ncbi:unnamed protein product [Symbiodinium natans]|uniref:BART domain-containing protein n=1 Tax=Symbiodinium natans TaxID=878477 RepID=A0A812QQW2_9DINO|nr:unnamed protein product [Symbiodinium natans]
MSSLLDPLAQWLEANAIQGELEAYVRKHAAAFAERDEYDHACFDIYRGYDALVRRILTEFLEEIRSDAHLCAVGSQATPERLLSELRQEGAALRRDAAGKRLQELLEITSFEEFAAAAGRLRRQAETEAACLLAGMAVRVAGGASRASPDARLEALEPDALRAFGPPRR